MSSSDKSLNMHLARVLAVIASPFILIGGILQLFLSFSDGKTTPGDFIFPPCFFVVVAVLYYLISGKNPPQWLGFRKK